MTASIEHAAAADRSGSSAAPSLVGVLVAGALVSVCVVLRGRATAELLVDGAPLTASVAIIAGMVAFRPCRWVPWSLLALGCAVQSVAMVILAHEIDAGSQPSTARAIVMLGYPAMIVGLVGIGTRTRDGWATRPSTAIYAAGIGTAIMAQAFLGPALGDRPLPIDDHDWIGAIVGSDLAIIVTVWWRPLRTGRRLWSTWLLGAGFVAWGNAHAAVESAVLGGDYQHGSTAAALLVMGPLLVGLGALQVDMADESATGGRVGPRAQWLGLVMVVAVIVLIGARHIDPARRLLLLLGFGMIAVTVVAVAPDDPDG